MKRLQVRIRYTRPTRHPSASFAHSLAIFVAPALLLCVLAAAVEATDFDIVSVNPAELDNAIAGSNASNDTEDTIFFTRSLNNLTMRLDETPTEIDGGPDKIVELDGSLTTLFLIRPNENVVDPDEDFILLHVKSGRAVIKDLNISAQGVDPDGDGDDLNGVFLVDSGAAIAWDSARECQGDTCLDNPTIVIDDITGDGQLVKLGEHTLVLTGENDWAGGSLIEEGELRGDLAALPGDFQIEEDGALAFDYRSLDQDAAYSGQVTGEGKLIKDGAGTLVILDDPLAIDDGLAMTGGTEIRAGKLAATTELIGGHVQVFQDAIFELHQEGAGGEYFEDITGDGELRKTGPDVLRLSGDNSFGGGLSIAEGMVVGDSNSIPGAILFEDVGTRIRFDQLLDGAHSGGISGPGTLEKDGPGTLTLNGTSTHTGGTLVSAGTLRGDTVSIVDLITLGQPSAGIDFRIGGLEFFDGLIAGPGTLVKSGAGTLVLSRVQNYLGDTTVQAGTLRLDVDVPDSSTIIVNRAGTLQNGQSLGRIGGDLVSTGTVDPGGIGDIFQIGGDANLAGSTLRLDLNDVGGAPFMDVAGIADVDAMMLGIAPEPGLYDPAVSYLVLEANAITGTPDPDPTLDFAFLFVENISIDTSVPGAHTLGFDLHADVSDIDQFAITPNQTATANAMEQVLASGTPDSETILESFSVLTRQQVPLVLDQLAGETLSAFTTGRITNAQLFNQMIAQRFHATEYERGRTSRVASGFGLPRLRRGAVAATPSVAAEPPSNQGPTSVQAVQQPGSLGAWLEPFAVFGDYSGRPNASDITARLYGVSGGVDYRLPERLGLPRSERVRLGAGLGYTRSSLENDRGGLMTGSGNTIQTALYAGYRSTNLHVGLAGRYAWSSMDTQRRIAFQAIDRTARADFTGHEVGAFVEVGGHFGDPKKVWLHPLASFQYDHLTQEAFRETNAGDLSLGVNGSRWDSMLLTAGARISRLFTLQGEFGLEPEIRGGYIHEFGDTDRPVRSRFWPVPGATPFVTVGAPADSSTGWIGTAHVMSVADVPLLSLAYDAYFGENVTRHVLAVGVYFRW
ncbi:MAG: autotransporter domain-containing protein [Deltaproteobacteria bacterium]|nr:autotransporter domain-containing protein [Deltaproteobacteria bacterium]